MKKIAIFASGNGSNAENIARYFADSEDVMVSVVLSNRENAGVHARMQELGVPSITFSKDTWKEATPIVEYLQANDIDLVVLAGFMSMIEAPITAAYAGRIINIHPSLLPKYGGIGMWGMHVHRAVVAAGEKETGITIHYVNEKVDGGEIIVQGRCAVLPGDTAEIVSDNVHKLEYEHYPKAILDVLKKYQ